MIHGLLARWNGRVGINELFVRNIFAGNFFFFGGNIWCDLRWIFGRIFRIVTMVDLTGPGERTSDSTMVRLLTNITQNIMGTIGCEMTKLFTIVADDRVTRINIMAGLIAMTTGTGLAIITKMDQDLTKANKIRDGLFNSYSEMTHAILDMGPTFFWKITAAVVENITILRQALNDGFIRHLMRSIKNLNICQRTVDILEGKRMATNTHNIMG